MHVMVESKLIMNFIERERFIEKLSNWRIVGFLPPLLLAHLPPPRGTGRNQIAFVLQSNFSEAEKIVAKIYQKCTFFAITAAKFAKNVLTLLQLLTFL